MAEYPHAGLTQEIIGAALEVHNVLGPGFREKIYEEALKHELEIRQLSVKQQVSIPIRYKGVTAGTHILDLIINDKVIVELKAASDFDEVHRAIVISYLTATRLPVALLLNFGKQSLDFRRIVRSKSA